MLKRSTVENIYILFLLFIWTMYSCFAMVDGEDKGLNIGSGLTPIFVVLSFILSIPYLIINFSDLFKRRMYRHLLNRWACYYMFVFIVTFLLSGGYGVKAAIFRQINVILPFVVMLVIFLYVQRYGVTVFFQNACFVIFLVLIIQYFRLYSILEALLDTRVGGSYYSLLLLPIILFYPKKEIRYISVVLTLLVLLSSLKRGGLLAFALGILVYIIFSELITKKQHLRGILISAISVIALVLVFLWIDMHSETSMIERFSSIREDEGSGRMDVWRQTWLMILNSSGLHFLFGHGYGAVLQNSPLFLSAHNDWLEIWYDYGFFSFLLFIGVMFSWLQLVLHLYKCRHPLTPHLAMLLVIVGVLMMISHIIIYPWMIWVCLSLGVFLGQYTYTNKLYA